MVDIYLSFTFRIHWIVYVEYLAFFLIILIKCMLFIKVWFPCTVHEYRAASSQLFFNC